MAEIRQLFSEVLGLGGCWRVLEVERRAERREVEVRVERRAGGKLECPRCGAACPGHDSRRRRWRHLDFCDHKLFVVCDVPRASCTEHGVVTIRVPWAEAGSRYTADFEVLAIDWLLETSTAAVARQLRLSWNAADGIRRRAVRRGLARRSAEEVRRLGVDETSFRRRHRYVTVVSDPDRARVVYVAPGRDQAALEGFFETLSEDQRRNIASVSMDMWRPFIEATRRFLPDAEDKIAFDRFHVARHLAKAVDKVRRNEHRELLAHGDTTLTGSKYRWLRNPANATIAQRVTFAPLRHSTLRTARAWAIKEHAACLWGYASRTWANKGWKRWLAWALRCRLEPVQAAARMVRAHLWGIVNAAVLRVSNGPAESINSRIKTIKLRSRGFRNTNRFIEAIYFQLGDLQLYPDAAILPPTHYIR